MGILGDQALPVVEMRPKKALSITTTNTLPAPRSTSVPAQFDAVTTKRIQDAAMAAFRAIGGRDYCARRCDGAARTANRSSWKSTRCRG